MNHDDFWALISLIDVQALDDGDEEEDYDFEPSVSYERGSNDGQW